MNIIVLGGNSKKNIKWVNEIKNLYIEDNVYIINYNHWVNNKEIDIDIELDKLINVCNKLDEYIIICKSVGSIITLNAIIKNFIKPLKVVILGLPIYMCYKENIDINNIIRECSLKTKIIVIEQENDPIGSSIDVKKMLPNNIKLYVIEGNDHAYDNYVENKFIIDSFIKGEWVYD